MNRFWSTIGICLTCLWHVAIANTNQDHQVIRDAVAEYVHEHYKHNANAELTVEVGQLDSRLQLNQCNTPIDVFVPNGNSLAKASVLGVRCQDQTPWKIYVPITVALMQEIAVAAKPIARGDIIQNQDVDFELMNILSLRKGYYVEVEPIVGKQAKMSLHPGSVIVAAKLQIPIAIKRGDSVSIIAEKGPLKVVMKGRAMKNGAIGDDIPVRNNKSKRIVDGKIIEAGVVKVVLS